jgi:hypothetical protein
VFSTVFPIVGMRATWNGGIHNVLGAKNRVRKIQRRLLCN